MDQENSLRELRELRDQALIGQFVAGFRDRTVRQDAERVGLAYERKIEAIHLVR